MIRWPVAAGGVAPSDHRDWDPFHRGLLVLAYSSTISLALYLGIMLCNT